MEKIRNGVSDVVDDGVQDVLVQLWALIPVTNLVEAIGGDTSSE